MTLSIVEASKSCTIDIYRTTYWDRGNRGFTVKGVRMEWLPAAAVWSINLKVRHVAVDGTISDIVDVTFADDDTNPRAENGKPGKYKRTDFSTFIDGQLAQGLIVVIDQTSINEVYLEVVYEK